MNPVHSINSILKTKANKSTPTKARVTFSDTTPSTPAANTSSDTETTPPGSIIDAADDIRFTETLNKFFSKKLLAILTGKETILKEIRDCIIRKDPHRLRKISPYIFLYWQDISVKHGCICVGQRNTQEDRGCSARRHPFDPSWKHRDATFSTKHLVAIYISGYTGK